ncbi:protein HOS4-like isoform X1 [Haliotis rubra]|uniref:protein HOS4-like isoform X1 n=1 Tax=Haliotis rubra TaxID=36100 RepID=UPI001EE63295|nr:protein HOS4-like isoform X1 [Haliotis rubra]
MELSTVIFFGLLLCGIQDVCYAWASFAKLPLRVSLVESEINTFKRTALNADVKLINKFKVLESSLKEEMTTTFLPPLIKPLVKQAIIDIMNEDYIGNIITGHVLKVVDRLKAKVQNTETQVKVLAQQLRRVERDRDTYRKSLRKLRRRLTKDIRALHLRGAGMLQSELNQTNDDLFATKHQIVGLKEDLMALNVSCWKRKDAKESDVTERTLTTPSLSHVSSTTPTTMYPGTTTASTDPSPSKTVPLTPVTPLATQDSDLQASTDPSSSTKVPPPPVTTQDSDLHATPSPATDRDLYSASEDGDLERVKRILGAGHVDINTRGDYSRTPVMVAALEGHRDVVELLVDRGADVSLVDVNGTNVLHWACFGGDLEIVKLILSLNAVDINARDNRGRTAADWAKLWGHQPLLALLV